MESSVQRLLNALEPGTSLLIHRHRHTDETYVLLRGHIRVLIYNDSGQLTGTTELSQQKGNFGIHISKGQWHSLEVLETGSVIFEVKEGPYSPITAGDILSV
jgi:cupin fold WbuC family metalloprotein